MSTKSKTMKAFMDNTVNMDELEKRRQQASDKIERRKPQKDQPEFESEAMTRINEIFNPTLKLPMTKGPYHVPDAVKAGDLEALENLDVRKVAELKEVFLLFDTDCDGLISKNDLRFTFTALGSDVNEDMIEEMLQEAKEPLDFDAFVDLMSHRTIELDPEEVLLEAWSKWDEFGTGKVEEKKMYEEVTNYGDCLTTEEADEAFRHAPIVKNKCLDDPPMIDYLAFCNQLSGMRTVNNCD